jgi:ABC-type methionine transport system ATPase subunit
LLAIVGDKLGRYADQLSQGEKQRVAVIRALVVLPPAALSLAQMLQILFCNRPV